MDNTKIDVKGLIKVFYQTVSNNSQSHHDLTQLSQHDKLVLNNLTFTFNSGEIIGLIGCNGAGKSTLLSILAGVTKETGGVLDIQGKVTAVMTLGVGLREDLTGRENIYLDGALQGKTRTEVDQNIEEIIAFTELNEFIDKPIKFYSTGMKSRLAFSMLVGLEPEILIIDEALSAGDFFFAQKAAQKIKEICSKGKIVIIVSHSMSTIESMCTRCLWLENGSIVMDGKPEVVTKKYLEKIREQDQSFNIEENSSSYSRNESAIFKLKNVIMRLKDSDYPQRIFYTHDSIVICTEIEVEQVPKQASIYLMIERTDGVLASVVEYHLCPEELALNTVYHLEWALESLVLNKGYFQLTVQILENQSFSNEFKCFFEVKNTHIFTGGVPLLHYPVEIGLFKEIPICSGSIEMITE